ncbi:MAG: hypothetical protein HQL52_00995 [Magnetococcales bacterium]|nr:hypothetical protein [Magnetococcales bacterium]
MTADNEEFDDCPAGQEVDSFHDRIRDGLQDAFLELADRHQEISRMAPEKRSSDEELFLTLHRQVQERLEKVGSAELAYDKRYELAQEIRESLTEMEFL